MYLKTQSKADKKKPLLFFLSKQVVTTLGSNALFLSFVLDCHCIYTRKCELSISLQGAAALSLSVEWLIREWAA